MFHWSKVLKNHCRVWEFFPSVSAVIGDYKPEMNVWRVAIALGSGPRFVSAVLNYKLLSDALPSRKAIIKTAFIIDVSRIVAAGGWTFISSSEYNFEHSVCYVIYAVSSFVYMAIHTPLFYQTKGKTGSRIESTFTMSYRWKQVMFILHVLMFFVSLYFFLIEHQQHCMPGGTYITCPLTISGYSRYALCEWVLSVCNVLYDTSSYLDFDGYYITLEEQEKRK